MSAKGLEWALRLRADLVIRIELLRESLAGIEPLRQELARLEEQLKGVERLVAVYHDQLGYPKADEVALPVMQPALTHAQQALQLEAAFIPVKPPEPPTLAIILRGEARRTIAVLRNGATLAQKTAARLWLSLRVWLADRFPRSNTLA